MYTRTSGVIVGDPAVVSWGPGRIDLFVEGHDGKLWQQWSVCSGCQWSGWIQPVTDGTLASGPAVTSWAPGRIDVVVQGTDDKLYQRDWDTNAWSGAWQPIGAPSSPSTPVVGEQPTVTTYGPGRLDVFVRGTDNKLWQNFFINQAWQGWFQPPGTSIGSLNSAPAATWWTGVGQLSLTVFVQGVDNHLYQTTYDGTWSAWAIQGTQQDVFQGAPETVSTFQVDPYVLVRGTDNRCYGFAPAN